MDNGHPQVFDYLLSLELEVGCSPWHLCNCNPEASVSGISCMALKVESQQDIIFLRSISAFH
jgi:hypothetical protein